MAFQDRLEGTALPKAWGLQGCRNRVTWVIGVSVYRWEKPLCWEHRKASKIGDGKFGDPDEKLEKDISSQFLFIGGASSERKAPYPPTQPSPPTPYPQPPTPYPLPTF